MYGGADMIIDFKPVVTALVLLTWVLFIVFTLTVLMATVIVLLA